MKNMLILFLCLYSQSHRILKVMSEVIYRSGLGQREPLHLISQRIYDIIPFTEKVQPFLLQSSIICGQPESKF